MTTHFINAFRRLCAHERHDALSALTTELSPYEWRALHATLSRRSFQLDIIGSLPLELVVQIFCYLDVAAPYRLQRVSRRWKDILGSLDVLKGSLHQWYQGTVNLQDAHHTLCRNKARSIHALRTGRPNHIYKIIPNARIHHLKLVGNSLIWKHVFDHGQPSRFACVLDLDQWHLDILGGQAREEIINLSASSEILVLATRAGICYVYDLRDERSCKKFRVPNIAYFANIACRGRTVVCLHSSEQCTSVYIWEYDLQRGSSFQIKRDEKSSPFESDPVSMGAPILALLIQPQTKTIVIFADASHTIARHRGLRNLVFSRYTYSGERISTHYPSLPEHFAMLPNSSSIINLAPIDYKESLFAMHIERQTRHDTLSSCLLLFNEEDNDLSVGWDSTMPDDGIPYHYGGPMALWKDTCYGFLCDDDAEQQDILAHMGTSDARRYMPVVSEPIAESMDRIPRNINIPVMMNEKYVVRNAMDSLYLLCFDNDDHGKRPESGSFFDMGELVPLPTR